MQEIKSKVGPNQGTNLAANVGAIMESCNHAIMTELAQWFTHLKLQYMVYMTKFHQEII